MLSSSLPIPDNAHPLLAHALRAAGDQAPPGPFHLDVDGPVVTVPVATQVEIAIFAAETVRPLETQARLPAFDEELATARRRLTTPRWPTAGQWSRARDPDSTSASSLDVAQCAADAALHFARNRELVCIYSRPAVEMTVRLLRAHDVGAMRSFICELDARLLRAEFIAAVTGRAPDPVPTVRRVLWRGAEKNMAHVVHIITELEGDVNAALKGEEPLYGILTKQGRRYRWLVGSRDDVLATVPDHHMEAAVQAVLAQS